MMKESIVQLYQQNGTLSFLGTAGEDGFPHISVYNSLTAQDENTLIFGEYCRGKSKDNAEVRKQVGFFTKGAEGSMVGGIGRWTEKKDAGEEQEKMNQESRLRYNATYGYAQIHFIRTEEVSVWENGACSAESSRPAAGASAETKSETHLSVLSLLGAELFTEKTGIKMLSYFDAEGYPRVVPAPPMHLQEDLVRVNFSASSAYGEMIAEGTPVALFSFVPALGAGIMVKGLWSVQGQGFAEVRIEKVYNPNVPKADYIYPLPPLMPVRCFAGARDV